MGFRFIPRRSLRKKQTFGSQTLKLKQRTLSFMPMAKAQYRLPFRSQWVIEPTKELPSSAHIDAFDLSDQQFPPQAWLPKNMVLSSEFDTVGDISGHLKGIQLLGKNCAYKESRYC